MAEWELEQGSRLSSELQRWTASLTDEQRHDKRYVSAIAAVDEALAETIKVMKGLRDGAKETRRDETRLSRLWREASRAVGPLDYELSDACMMKGMGWIDPRVWDRARKKGMKISVEDMQDALRKLNGRRCPPGTSPSWFPIVGVIFTVFTIGFLVYLLLQGQPIEPNRKLVFDVLMAISVAASAAFLGGSAVASGRIPFFENSPVQFSAFGGIGVFTLVFLLMHSG